MEIVVPKAGLTIETAEIVEWRVEPGAAVKAGDLVVVIAADKVDFDVEAPADGFLADVHAVAGDTVVPGQVIATISAEPPTTEAPAQSERGTDPAISGEARRRVLASPQARRLASDLRVPVEAVAGSGPNERVLGRDVRAHAERGSTRPDSSSPAPTSPAARRRARELNVPIDEITGSGPGGRVRERDVNHYASAFAANAVATSVTTLVPAKWSTARRVTARRMAESAALVAPVTLHRRAAAAAALSAVQRAREDGTPATLTHSILWSVAGALKAHPALNAIWQGEDVLLAASVDVGLAVDVEGDLFVGVLHDIGDSSLREIVAVATDVLGRVRARKATRADLTGATFTVSNLGMFGVESFTPIVNLPQVGVLGVGAVTDGMCHLSLTFDHRAVDGAPAARFLATVAERMGSMHGA